MNTIKYIGEFLGTFIFISVILIVGEPIPISVGLLASIYLIGKLSGGHMNPAVSISMLINKKISNMDCIGYIFAQCLGGIAAVYFAKMIKK